MKGSERIQISSDQFFAKLILTLAIFIIGVILYYDSRPVANPDFKVITEYKIFFLVSILFFIYIFTRPVIHYDIKNFYIKKIGKIEIIVPLDNISSIHKYSSYKWGAFYSIKYFTTSEESGLIKFYVSDFSTTIFKFINDIKTQNPKVIIS